MNEIETVKDKVKSLLEKDLRCRNDDKWLIWRYIRDVDKIDIYIPFDKFAEMTSFESIRRARAIVQNVDHELLPTNPDVIKRRGIKQQEWTEYFSNHTGVKNDRRTQIK